jgi:hypothetical protein
MWKLMVAFELFGFTPPGVTFQIEVTASQVTRPGARQLPPPLITYSPSMPPHDGPGVGARQS